MEMNGLERLSDTEQCGTAHLPNHINVWYARGGEEQKSQGLMWSTASWHSTGLPWDVKRMV